MAGKSITLKAMRANAEAQVPPRLGLRVVVLFLLLQTLLLVAVSLMLARAARAETMKGEISVNTNAGYARLVFTFPEENDADVRLANGVIVISFKKPIDISADRIVAGAASYISAARRDRCARLRAEAAAQDRRSGAGAGVFARRRLGDRRSRFARRGVPQASP